jgi:hypothetical protein
LTKDATTVSGCCIMVDVCDSTEMKNEPRWMAKLAGALWIIQELLPGRGHAPFKIVGDVHDLVSRRSGSN